MIGTMQATETLKWITGVGELLAGRLILLDALKMQFNSMKIERDPGCAVCGETPTITDLIDYEEFCHPNIKHEREAMIPEITVVELKERQDKNEKIVLLDVRQENEHQFVNIGGTLVPLHQLADRVTELDPAAETIVYCRSGARSATAVQFLMNAGFSDVKNLQGGILAWATEIDPSLPKY
jgi:adenylyltransferase/sulfurtransferase